MRRDQGIDGRIIRAQPNTIQKEKNYTSHKEPFVSHYLGDWAQV
jgi:hypothetical protein